VIFTMEYLHLVPFTKRTCIIAVTCRVPSQMVGDLAYVMIPASAPIPAMGRQVFTTVHDNQTDMRILVLEGDFSQASRCNLLGHFDLEGLPPGPKGARLELIAGWLMQVWNLFAKPALRAPGLPLFVVVLVVLVCILGSCAALSAFLHPVPLPMNFFWLPLRFSARAVLQRGP
jgi:hypothetical protein